MRVPNAVRTTIIRVHCVAAFASVAEVARPSCASDQAMVDAFTMLREFVDAGPMLDIRAAS